LPSGQQLLVCGCSNPLFGGFPSESDLGVAFPATEADVGDAAVAEHNFPDIARRDRAQELFFGRRFVLGQRRCWRRRRRDDHRRCVLLDGRRFITSLATQNAEQGHHDEPCASTHHSYSTKRDSDLFQEGQREGAAKRSRRVAEGRRGVTVSRIRATRSHPTDCDTLVPVAAPLDEPPENRQVMTEYPRRKPNPFGHVIRWLRDTIEGPPPAVMTEYPRRKPNPILHLIRWLLVLFAIYVILRGIIAPSTLLEWGNVPAVLAFGYVAYILFRNRRRRQRACDPSGDAARAGA
jgi:hypothetical protein